MSSTKYLSAAFIISAALVVSTAGAQDVGPQLAEVGFNRGFFRFDVSVRDVLRLLWKNSTDAHEERVACIGGYRFGDVTYITKVTVLRSFFADSARATAVGSLRECGAPEWLGTVHTHIAKFHGLPYVTFSPADRAVMAMWRGVWHEEGVFCVLFSEFEAHCEAGYSASDDTAYALQRGNRITN